MEMTTTENPFNDYFGTPKEFNQLGELMDWFPELRTRTIGYVNALLGDMPEEERKAVIDDYSAFLVRFDFQRYGLDDALGDFMEGRR